VVAAPDAGYQAGGRQAALFARQAARPLPQRKREIPDLTPPGFGADGGAPGLDIDQVLDRATRTTRRAGAVIK